MRAVQQRVPGLAEYLQAAAQRSGSEPAAMQTEASSVKLTSDRTVKGLYPQVLAMKLAEKD